MKLLAKTATVLKALTIALGFSYAAIAFDPQTLYQRTSPAVVLIAAPDGKAVDLGSGVITNSQGLIVTNNHVVANSQRVAVKLADGSIYPGVVISRSPKDDLALIQIRPNKPLPSLRVQTVLPNIGQRVYVVGNPLGYERSFSDGIVSRIDEKGIIQYTAATSPGSSGSPLLDENGNVVGIVRSIVPGTSLNFAIPSLLVFNLSSTGKAVDRQQQATRNYIQTADAEMRRGNYQQALEIYSKAIRQNPNGSILFRLYNGRGLARAELKDYQGAIEDYSRSIQATPNSPAYYNRAIVRGMLRQYQPAIDDFTQSIQLNRLWGIANPGEALYGRGQIYSQQGNRKAAISDLQRAARYFSAMGNTDRYRAVLDQITLLTAQ